MATEATEACLATPKAKSDAACISTASTPSGPFIELRLGLAIRGIRRPHLTRADGPSGGDQLPLEKRDHRRLACDLIVWRQVVIRSSLVTNRAGCHHETRER